MGFDAALQQLRTWYLLSIGSLGCGILIGLLILAYEIPPQEGLIADHIWPARIAFAAWSPMGLALAWYLSKRPPRSSWTWPREASPEVQQWAAHTTVRLAFSDAIGVYGLLLFLYSGQLVDVLAFGFASALAIAWNFPRKSDWERQHFEDANPKVVD